MSAVPFILSLLAPVLAPLGGTPATPAARRADPPVAPVVLRALARHDDAPRVHVWITDDRSVYDRGDRVRVRFSSDDDAYVFILRIDTDGRMRVLFPRHPDDDPFIQAGDTYRLPGYAAGGFRVDDYPGVGYVFAIASRDRFVLDRYNDDGYWNYHLIGGRINDDPFEAVHRFAERILYDRDDPYTVDYAEYDVGRHYDYPRFVCYQCHTYHPYHTWDPYDHPCVRFHLVIYDEPDYYPYRYYPGTRVVYQRQPRYVFKQATGGEVVTQATFIERRRRTDSPEYQRPGRPGAGPVGSGGGSQQPGRGSDNTHAPRGAGHNPQGGVSYGNHPGLGTPHREPTGGDASGGGSDNGQGNGVGQGNGNGGDHGHRGQGNGDRGNNGNGRGPGSDNGVGNGGIPGNGRGRTGDQPGRSGGDSGAHPGRGTPNREGGSSGSGRGEDRAVPQRESNPDQAPADQRRSEPRDEPRSTPREEPRRTEPRSEPRSEPRRSEPSRSEPTRSSGHDSDKRSSGSNSHGRRPPV